MARVNQSILDYKLQRAIKESGLPLAIYSAYGYKKLCIKVGSGLSDITPNGMTSSELANLLDAMNNVLHEINKRNRSHVL